MQNRENHLNIHDHHLPQPTEIKIVYALNLRGQMIKCPLCSYKSKCLKSPRLFTKHFTKTHKRYTLRMVYSCTICESEIPEDERETHIKDHGTRKIPLTPPVRCTTPNETPIPPNSNTRPNPLHLLELHRQRTPTPTVNPEATDPENSPTSSEDSTPQKSQSLSPTQDIPSSPPSLTIDETPFEQSPPQQCETPESPKSPPTPELLTQKTPDHILMRRFLNACNETPTCSRQPQQTDCTSTPPSTSPPKWELAPHQNLPLIGDVSLTQNSPTQDAEQPQPHHQPIATPSAAIPPLMANIIHTPDLRQPSTRQPSPPTQHPTQTSTKPIPRRPVAADFFSQPTSQPVMEDIEDADSSPEAPPRPTALSINQPTPPPNADSAQSPILEDPSSQSFPTNETAEELAYFRYKWQTLLDEESD